MVNKDIVFSQVTLSWQSYH